MPFKSEKQRRFLYSQEPEVAKKFAAHEGPKGAMQRKLKGMKNAENTRSDR